MKGSATLKELSIRPGATFYHSDATLPPTLALAAAAAPLLSVGGPLTSETSLLPTATTTITTTKSKKELEKELQGKLTVDSVLTELAKLTGIPAEIAWEFVDKKAAKVMESKSFISIKEDLLLQILKRDTLGIAEAALFDAVLKWGKENGGSSPEKLKAVLAKSIPFIRFPVMSSRDIAAKVFVCLSVGTTNSVT